MDSKQKAIIRIIDNAIHDNKESVRAYSRKLAWLYKEEGDEKFSDIILAQIGDKEFHPAVMDETSVPEKPQVLSKDEFEDILLGTNERELNSIESLIKIFSSPIAKRKGVMISKEDCELWIEELKELNNKINNGNEKD